MQDMQKRILFLGTFYIVFFLVVPVLFFSSQQKNTKHPKEIETKEKIPLDHATISKLLQDILKECLPLQTLQADISEDGIVTLSASMTKKDAKKTHPATQSSIKTCTSVSSRSDSVGIDVSFGIHYR